MTKFIRAPLINVNDEEMVLVEWTKSAGARVRKGEVVAVIETTKSTADLEADAAGYLHQLVEPGAEIQVGQLVAALTDSPDESPDLPEEIDPPPSEASEAIRWTRKAQLLAQEKGLVPENARISPADGATVRESDVEQYLALHTPSVSRPASIAAVPGPERVAVVGAGGAGIQILDVITRVSGQVAVGLLDDNEALHGQAVMGVPCAWRN